MKFKTIIYGIMFAIGVSSFFACNNDDEQTILPTGSSSKKNKIKNNYFTIESGVYKSGTIPASTIDAILDNVFCNDKALKNGGDFIKIMSYIEYEKFYIGVEGVNGYYEIDASDVENDTDDNNNFSYTIPVLYSINLIDDFSYVIKGMNVDGGVTNSIEKPITVVESMEGDLLINLVFDEEKDVDLHLIMPDGREIYYGDRGDMSSDGEQLFGLDHDSNPGCAIDGLNNENIFIPSEYIEKGTYTVIVNLYENCDYTVPVNYSLQVRYKEAFVENLLNVGANPVIGFYPKDADDDDFTCVMEFYIDEGIDVKDGKKVNGNKAKRIPISPMAETKLMMKK